MASVLHPASYHTAHPALDHDAARNYLGAEAASPVNKAKQEDAPHNPASPAQAQTTGFSSGLERSPLHTRPATPAKDSPFAEARNGIMAETSPLLGRASHSPGNLSSRAAKPPKVFEGVKRRLSSAGDAPATSTMLTTAVVLAWYASNIGLLLMNKYLLGMYGFKKPVFLTLCHMVACMALSFAASATAIVPRQSLKSRRQAMKIGTLAVFFCLAVVLGNVALRFIPVSFSQAIGATTPVFTAVLAWACMGASETWSVYATLIPVVVGIVIATGAEPSFNLAGFAAGVGATFGRALKSVLQGILLADANEKVDSMNLLRFMAPIATLCLVPATLILEPGVMTEAWHLALTSPSFLFFLSVNAALAYVVNLTNFLVTKYTSALTLQVLGNAKGVAAVIISIMVFRNPVTAVGMGGYLITVMGVVVYVWAKRRAKATASGNTAMPRSGSMV